MTDADINLAIAKIEYPDYKIKAWIGRSAVVPVGHPSIRSIDYMQWCWIGPIIEREKINLLSIENNSWTAKVANYGANTETPTKAAALCFLKMKGVDV